MLISSPKRILILAANPKKTGRLQLDEEVREIEEVFQRSPQRDQFQLVPKWAVAPRAMQQAIVEETLQIVHFSGHGEGEAGIILEDAAGQAKPVGTGALAGLFALCSR